MMNLNSIIGLLTERFPLLFVNPSNNNSADQEVADLVESLSAIPESSLPIAPDPFLLEENFHDVAEVLDRLLAIRREINQIEAERLSAALGYRRTIDIAECDSDIEIAKDAKVRDAATNRVTHVAYAIDEILLSHKKPGSPLNYTERIDKLKFQLRLDVTSAYCRSKCVIKGLEVCNISIDAPLPTSSARKYALFEGSEILDDWCGWHRHLSNKLEKIQKNLFTHELLVPLKSDRTEDPLVFEPMVFHRVPNARLRGFAISFKTDNPTQQLSVAVVPPWLSSALYVCASPFGAQLNWCIEPVLHNRNAHGQWKLFRVASNVGHAPPSELHLHLRVCDSVGRD